MTRTSTLDGTRYLTTREVGELLRVSARTVAQWIHGGLVPATRIGKQFLIDQIALAGIVQRGQQ